MSWVLYSGINRENKKSKLKFNNEFALGKTILYNNIFINSLFYIGFDNLDIYIKPKLNILYETSDNIKLGLSSSYKEYYSSKDYYNNTIFINKKVDNLVYQLEYTNDNTKIDNKVLFQIKYNF